MLACGLKAGRGVVATEQQQAEQEKLLKQEVETMKEQRAFHMASVSKSVGKRVAC